MVVQRFGHSFNLVSYHQKNLAKENFLLIAPIKKLKIHVMN